VDDRGVGGSTGDPRTATSLDFAGDVKAGVDFLRHDKSIDPARVGLIGHSEGGMIAPVVAAEDPRLAFIVLLAGPGVTGLEITVGQTGDFTRATGKTPEEVAKAVALERKILAIAAGKDERAVAQKRLLPLLNEFGFSPAEQAAQVDGLLSPWYRQFLRLDPAPYLARVTCPVLALLGGKDLQVGAALNRPALTKALAKNKDATVQVLPDLNHLFQTAQTGLVNEYGQIEETMAPVALETMTDWVVKRTQTPKRP
jgi:pimeloyl-ACP methyl ester carboxylesterase